MFLCPVCGQTNCLTCKVIHPGKNCQQYQDDLRAEAMNSENAHRSVQAIEVRLKPKCLNTLALRDVAVMITTWPLGDVEIILQLYFLNSFYELIPSALPVKLVLPVVQCWRILLMISQHGCRLWLSAWWHQAITCTNVDPVLFHHVASLGHNGLNAPDGARLSEDTIFVLLSSDIIFQY